MKLWMPLKQCQCFFQKLVNVRFRELVAFFSRIVQKIANDPIETLRFPAHNVHEVLFIIL